MELLNGEAGQLLSSGGPGVGRRCMQTTVKISAQLSNKLVPFAKYAARYLLSSSKCVFDTIR